MPRLSDDAEVFAAVSVSARELEKAERARGALTLLPDGAGRFSPRLGKGVALWFTCTLLERWPGEPRS